MKGKGVDEKEIKPTCEQYGSCVHVTYCGVCGTAISRLECNWKALGHEWGEWVTIKKATAKENGMMQRVCSRDASHVEESEVYLSHCQKPDEAPDKDPASPQLR